MYVCVRDVRELAGTSQRQGALERVAEKHRRACDSFVSNRYIASRLVASTRFRSSVRLSARIIYVFTRRNGEDDGEVLYTARIHTYG